MAASPDRAGRFPLVAGSTVAISTRRPPPRRPWHVPCRFLPGLSQGAVVATSPKNDDQQQELERALEKEKRDDLQGDTEENRNLTGSTTWETLEEEARGEGREHGRKGE